MPCGPITGRWGLWSCDSRPDPVARQGVESAESPLFLLGFSVIET